MAHSIDFSRGKAAFFSYRQPAWHGLGEVPTTPVRTIGEALKLGQLDYWVQIAPNVHRLPSGVEIISDNSFFTFRTDTNAVLGDKLGRQYVPVQNDESLSVVEGLVSEGCSIETAGALDGGARAFICVQLPESINVNGTDEVRQFAVVACGHDGSMGILAYFTNTRVVCNNTLQVSFRDAVQKRTIRHTSSAKGKIEEAGKLMQIAARNKETVQRGYQILADTPMLQTAFFDYVGNVFFSEAEIKEMRTGKRAQEVCSTRKLNVVRDILTYYESGIGQADIKGTAWGAYNAVTGYFSNVKKYETAADRMDGLLFESGANTMQKALVLASNPADIVPLRAVPAQAFSRN